MPEKRFLISIGINDYEIKPLDYCVKDSEDICNCFTLFCNVNKCFNITSESEKPNANIYESFIKVIKRIETEFIQGNDSIYFYFSGHGAKADKSTSLVFHDRIVELQEIFNLLTALNPKFIFCLIDSCFSGIGIEDEIGKSANEIVFSQHLKLAYGYNIICASAKDSPAKEDENLKNGRLTHLFIDIIKNKVNYSDGILSLSKIYQLVDTAFKNNPLFRQYPFTQTKGLSTYPLAYENDTTDSLYFSSHYIEDIETYDWVEFKNDLSKYCLLKEDIINEFTRLTREILRNSKTWSKATFLRIEISKGNVSLYDNSGTFFDIFNPSAEIKINGGGKTAKIFKESFEDMFSFTYEIKEHETIQTFTFKTINDKVDVCEWFLDDLHELREFQRGKIFVIPESCEEYTIKIPQGGIDLSSVYASLETFIRSSQMSDKTITIIFSNSDRLKNEFIDILNSITYLGPHKVVIK